MKSIRILSPDLALLAEIDDYESLQFERQYHSAGSFELRINSHKKHVDTLQKKNLIMLGNNHNKVGIIRSREIGLDESGKQSETWIITGETLGGITKQRVAIAPVGQLYDTATGLPETVMKHYVNNHLVNPTDIRRKMSQLVLAPDLNRGKSSITFESRHMILHNVLEEISKLSGVGWEVHINFAAKKWEFDCYEGVDRTTNQSINAPIIFSTDFETLKEASFTDSDLEYKNVLFVVDNNSGSEVPHDAVEVGEGEGLERFENFVASDTTSEIPFDQQGLIELANVPDGIHFEAGIETVNSPFKFERDYFIGDIVTIKHTNWGVVIHPRITAVKEIYEASGEQLEVTFGEAKPTLISKIKGELKRLKK